MPGTAKSANAEDFLCWAERDDLMKKKILFINACVRDDSRTLQLAKRVLENMDGEIHECCLETENVQPLRRETLAKRDRLLADKEYSDEMLTYAREFAAADRIVIAAPYWDLTFPALLKAYLEHITVSGVTFYYDNGVPRGLCLADQLIFVTTAGGPMFADFGYEYVKTMANVFYGIENVHCFRAENLDVYGADINGILRNAFEEIDAYFAR